MAKEHVVVTVIATGDLINGKDVFKVKMGPEEVVGTHEHLADIFTVLMNKEYAGVK